MGLGLILAAAHIIGQAKSSYLSLTLRTTHYSGRITERCTEDVACNRVTLELRLPDGELLKLNGRRVVAMCADGVTPCHPLGYAFVRNRSTYEVSDEGELIVKRQHRVVISEAGTLERASTSENSR